MNALTTRTSESSRREDKENAAAISVTAQDAWKSVISTPLQRMASRDSFKNEINSIPDVEMADTASCTDDLSCCENGISSVERAESDDTGMTRPALHSMEIMCPAPECETKQRGNARPNKSVHEESDDESSVHPTDHLDIYHAILHYMRHRDWKKKLLTVILVLTAGYVIVDFIFFGFVKGAIQSFLDWMVDGNLFLGTLAFLGVFIISSLVFIPLSILSVGAGYVFASAYGNAPGVVIAVSVCFIGSTISALLSFVRARYMMRDLMKLFIRRYDVAWAIDQAMKEKALRILFLLRLCPLIPFNIVNYIGGISGAKAHKFTLSLLGILPTEIMTILIGTSLNSLRGTDLTNKERRIQLIAINVGLACSLVSLVIFWYFARKELKKEIAEQEMERIADQIAFGLDHGEEDSKCMYRPRCSSRSRSQNARSRNRSRSRSRSRSRRNIDQSPSRRQSGSFRSQSSRGRRKSMSSVQKGGLSSQQTSQTSPAGRSRSRGRPGKSRRSRSGSRRRCERQSSWLRRPNEGDPKRSTLSRQPSRASLGGSTHHESRGRSRGRSSSVSRRRLSMGSTTPEELIISVPIDPNLDMGEA